MPGKYDIPIPSSLTQTLHGTVIYSYIGVVWGVNVGIYSSPMECLGEGYILC